MRRICENEKRKCIYARLPVTHKFIVYKIIKLYLSLLKGYSLAVKTNSYFCLSNLKFVIMTFNHHLFCSQFSNM